MEENSEKMSLSDHDLLIIMHTTLKRVVLDIQELNDNTIGRIAILEETKVDKKEAQVEAVKVEKSIENTAKVLMDTTNLIRDDYEKRLRHLETVSIELGTQFKTWIIVGGAIWSIIMFAITHYIGNLI